MSLADVIRENIDSLRNFDWNDIDVNKAGAWPLPLRVAALVLVGIVTLLIGFWLVLSDGRSTLAHEVAREATLKQQFEAKWAQSSTLDAYQQQLADMKVVFGDLLRQLPTDTEVPGLLEDITAAGHAVNLEIESIKVQPEVSRDFYVELPIDIVVDGGYHDLGTFVGAVANQPRIVTLRNLRIVPTRSQVGRGVQLVPNHLRMTVTAKTYRYKDQGSKL